MSDSKLAATKTYVGSKIVKLSLLMAFIILLLASCVRSPDVAGIIAQVAYIPERPAEITDLRVGVIPGPYERMFTEYIAPLLVDRGYTVRLVHFDDFIHPNLALADGVIDLNVFQHSHDLNDFKFYQGVDISAVAEIPTSGETQNEALGAGYKTVIAVRTNDLARQFVRSILEVVQSDEFIKAILDEDSEFKSFHIPASILHR